MLRTLMALACFFFPWLVLLINDNPGGAVVALIMQGSLFGWPFASVWAWRTAFPKKQAKQTKTSKTLQK